MYKNHETRIIDGVPLIVRKGLHIPWDNLKDFPNCCGPGKGLLNLIIPDTMYFLRMSAACWLHDKDFELAEPDWGEFKEVNEIFKLNMYSIIIFKSKYGWLRQLRLWRADKYHIAVSTTIAFYHAFWKLKEKQMDMMVG